MRLKVKYGLMLSSFAFKYNLRRYIGVADKHQDDDVHRQRQGRAVQVDPKMTPGG